MSKEKKTNVGILSHAGWESGGGNILFPLFKYRRQIQSRGFNLAIFRSHALQTITKSDVLIVMYRYFQQLLHKAGTNDKTIIIDFLEHCRKKGVRAIFFDPGDGTGSRGLEVLPYVEKFLKKQLLKDRLYYTRNDGDKSVRIWIGESDDSTKEIYKPASVDQLQKLQLGWNIGLTDYRAIPQIHRLGFLTNRLIWTPRTVAPGGTHRHLDTQFRGSLASDKGCAEQRNQVINTLRKLVDTKKYKIQLGSRVPRRTFLQELKQSKVCISPFGWGELCYRDFEGMQMGSLLIKPSVSHAETFPDYFQEHETYVPIRWDISDLTETFEEVIQNYTHYLDIARAAQKKLEFYATNAEAFVDHFVKIIS